MSYSTLNNDRLNYNMPGEGLDLKAAAVNFIHEHCTDLRFDPRKTDIEKSEGKLLGTSISPNQIPYNMQMDVDRLCFENALKNFLTYGSGKNAFDVYFCYIEMFIGKYAACRRMIEMLSEYESNGSSLLMKHRDHYSHSVYVFALGLAIYETNTSFRDEYKKFYGISGANEAAHHFLKFWGLTSLFHDIGYPFEIPFEQVEAYFEVKKEKRVNSPYLMYGNLHLLADIDGKTNDQLKAIFGKEGDGFKDTNSLFAYDIAEKLGKTYRIDKSGLEVILRNKPTDPDCFNYYMDHAYFSANLLFRALSSIENDGEPYRFEKATIDALTAILLHNSLYKFSIAYYKSGLNIPFKAELHPLAYMLMLCDELQCWNRTSYGRNSRTELHPMGCRFTFSDGKIEAQYIFDENEKNKTDKFIEARKSDNKAKLKAFSGMYVSDEEKAAGKKCEFLDDIEKIVSTEKISLDVSYDFAAPDRKHKDTYLSNCNFIHLYNFAAALNARYSGGDLSREDQEKQFDALSLEYKLLNIGQAKAFDRYLNEIGCFYTDKEVDFDIVTEFKPEDMEKIGPLEHGRWIRDHRAMGWGYGKIEDKSERENSRLHKLMMDIPADADEKTVDEMIVKHYHELPADEQDKDTAPMNHMLKLLKKFEGLRIYRLK